MRVSRKTRRALEILTNVAILIVAVVIVGVMLKVENLSIDYLRTFLTTVPT
jgi:hypothetical protein